jgi:hypothetical protein
VFLLLHRFLEFVNALLKRLEDDPEQELGPAARAAYQATLYPFHGYLSSSVFSVRLCFRCRARRAAAQRVPACAVVHRGRATSLRVCPYATLLLLRGGVVTGCALL